MTLKESNKMWSTIAFMTHLLSTSTYKGFYQKLYQGLGKMKEYVEREVKEISFLNFIY